MADPESTVVGKSILITGNLEGDENLTVQGRVEGSIALSKTLIVEDGGIVRAEVQVRHAIISGIVVGNVEAQESVEVTDTGRLVGDIKAPRVIVVAGAKVRGAVDMGNLDAPRPSGPIPSTTSRSLSSRSSSSFRSSTPARRTTPTAPATPTKKAAPAPAKAQVASKSPPKKKLKKKIVKRR